MICAKSYERGSARFIERAQRAIAEALKPPPKLTLSQWANRYAHLSPETSADAGKFRAFGYQNGIMDSITDPSVKQVTVIKSARVGYTKILDHVVGYFIHQDPSPLLLVQPRVEDAEDYSRTEIAPMLRDTPVLAEIAGDLKAKDSNQRILKRVFRNGASVAFIGANSPGGFRRITARVAAFDEIDGYPTGGAGDEGDQIALGIKRTESFWNREHILAAKTGFFPFRNNDLAAFGRLYFCGEPVAERYQRFQYVTPTSAGPRQLRDAWMVQGRTQR